MARNQEKAQSMLNRFLQSKKDDAKQKQKRPFLSSDVNDISEAEKWRYQVVKEIAKKVGEIQNRGLRESMSDIIYLNKKNYFMNHKKNLNVKE